MDANDLTFGVEFETTIPAGAVPVGNYYSPNDLSEVGFPPGWRVKSDGSIRSGGGRQGAEFVSPILRGADGIRSVLAILRNLNDIGAKVNDSTGLHIHVGWSGVQDELFAIADDEPDRSARDPGLHAEVDAQDRDWRLEP
jgi:hypothetical protein